MQQRDLSRCQAPWQEFLLQYDFDIVYIHGEENSVADALSWLSHINMGVATSSSNIVAPVFTIGMDENPLADVKCDYLEDNWCKKLTENLMSMPEGSVVDGLLYWNGRLIIPRCGNLPESLFRLAHNTLGHFSSKKVTLS